MEGEGESDWKESSHDETFLQGIGLKRPRAIARMNLSRPPLHEIWVWVDEGGVKGR